MEHLEYLVTNEVSFYPTCESNGIDRVLSITSSNLAGDEM